MDVATRQHAAIGNAILTCEPMAHAVERADTAQGNKGGEAAIACIKLIELRNTFGLEHS